MLTQLNEQIAENKELSYIDALTGIKNRKTYDEKSKSLFLFIKDTILFFLLFYLMTMTLKNQRQSWS